MPPAKATTVGSSSSRRADRSQARPGCLRKERTGVGVLSQVDDPPATILQGRLPNPPDRSFKFMHHTNTFPINGCLMVSRGMPAVSAMVCTWIHTLALDEAVKCSGHSKHSAGWVHFPTGRLCIEDQGPLPWSSQHPASCIFVSQSRVHWQPHNEARSWRWRAVLLLAPRQNFGRAAPSQPDAWPSCQL